MFCGGWGVQWRNTAAQHGEEGGGYFIFKNACGSAIGLDRAETGSRQHETDLQPQWEWCTSLLAIDASTYDIPPSVCDLLATTQDCTANHLRPLRVTCDGTDLVTTEYYTVLRVHSLANGRTTSATVFDSQKHSQNLPDQWRVSESVRDHFWDNGALTETVFDTDGEWPRSLQGAPLATKP